MKGFTLLELVVVLGIFAVLSVMAYGGLNTVLTTRRAVDDAMTRTVDLQKAYLRMRDDFQQIRARPVRDGFGDVQPSLITQPDGRVEFTRGGWRNPLYQPRSALERVSYRVDEDDRLLRESWRVLDRAQDSAIVSLPVLEHVEDVRWQFLNEAQAWQAEWPPLSLGGPGNPLTTDAPPPRAVELTLVTKQWGELRFLFRTGTNAVQGAAP